MAEPTAWSRGHRARAESADFDAFYEASSARLLGQLYAMCGDLGEAQDCLQEAFLRAWQRWDRIAEYADPAGWVRTVAWNLAINRWRRTRNSVRAWTRHGPPPDIPETNPDNAALIDALRQIPDVQRQAVVLHHLVGLTVEQISDEAGIPSGTVKARLTRGRARLAELLAEEELA